jgi:pyruvate,water dikinase
VSIVPLREAREETEFGGKAVQLGAALRAELPVPPGAALAAGLVDAVAAGDPAATAELATIAPRVAWPVAVRSSAVGEDSAEASFAGQHLTLLNVRDTAALAEAVAAVWASARSEAALAYRARLGIGGEPRTGVVVQRLVDPEVAGVLFTRNPLSGADERMVEASWGLGEAVVAGIVIPDRFRIARDGAVLERTPGSKLVALRLSADGGTVERPVAGGLVEQLCLDDSQLSELQELASRCEEAFGTGRDLEWAFAGQTLYLLQCRAVTR